MAIEQNYRSISDYTLLRQKSPRVCPDPSCGKTKGGFYKVKGDPNGLYMIKNHADDIDPIIEYIRQQNG